MPDAPNTLTAKQERAIAELIGGATVTDAATAAGVCRQQVHEWLSQSGFSSALTSARRAAFTEALTRIASTASDAARVLEEIMNDSKQPGTVRVSAAAKILDAAFKASMLDELEDRIARLEQLTSGDGRGF